MSNDLKLSQEKWNVVLDLKDTVARQQITIDKLSRVINAQEENISKLQVDILKNTTNYNFNDIFQQGKK